VDASFHRRIEVAQRDARRRRHRTTDPEHLLAVVLEIRSEAERVHMRGLDPRELLERVEAHFTTLPVASAYRDTCDAPLAPALERVLQRMQGRAWLPFVGRVQMLDSLLLEPSVCQLVIGLRRGQDSRYVVQRARALAIASSHRLLGLDHVLRALLDLPSFAVMLERAGANAERLRSYLEESARPADSDHREGPSLETPLRRVLYAGKFPEADDTPMTIRQLAIALAHTDECDRYWEAAGTTPTSLLHALHVP
jgi:ATP-dependent Clp protease ATP-binding subunit ClpA